MGDAPVTPRSGLAHLGAMPDLGERLMADGAVSPEASEGTPPPHAATALNLDSVLRYRV